MLTQEISTFAALEAENAQLKLEIERLKKLAYKDQLTGINNRRSFDQTMTEEWNRADRSQSPISLLLVDIDYFKRYNDTNGHQAGDKLLQDLGAAFNAVPMRSFDLLARYGGEEFVVVLPACNIDGAMRVAESISAAAHACGVTVSIGAACIVPSEDDAPASLIKAADVALYRAKAEGRDRTVVAS